MKLRLTGRCVCSVASLLVVTGCACAQTAATTASGVTNAIPYYIGTSGIAPSGLYVSTSGNALGIGNNNPQYALDVSGDINFNGSVLLGGLPILQFSVAASDAFIGTGNTSPLVGVANTAVGLGALSNNTGSYNGAFGNAALGNNTSGFANLAFGTYALVRNTVGYNNSALGVYALDENIYGSNNTAVGNATLNNLIGDPDDPTVGTSNTAVGGGALTSLQTGSSNNAFGANSLTGLVSGIDNVALGDGAGDDELYGVNRNTVANQSIYLGASSSPLQSGGNNEIVIGAYAVGNGSNTVTLGNGSIANTYLQGGVHLSSTAGITFPGYTTAQVRPWTGVLNGGDYAESVDVSGDKGNYAPGDVIVIDPAHEGKFLESAEPYSRLVAGIYSTKPGVRGRRQLTDMEFSTTEIPMAMVGIVPTKVSAENGPIKIGDLLVTSSIMGTAMKGTDRLKMMGAVVGKALGNLGAGTGVIEVLVTLQ